MEVWRPPHDMPHLLEWWRPLMLVARRARAERVPWPIHLDEFNLVGRVRREQGGRPDLWIYEHHGSRSTIHADATGRTYRFIASRRGPGIGQFRPCEVRQAVYAAGLHHVVEPVRYESRPADPPGAWRLRDRSRSEGAERRPAAVRPAGSARPSAAVAAAPAPEPPAPGRQRGHLRVFDGQVEAS